MTTDALTLALVVALISSFAMSAAARGLGRRIGLLDTPEGDGLKIHSETAVPLGGLGVIIGIYLGFASAGFLSAGFLLASSLLWLVGLVDDFRLLNPLTRLVAALGAGLALVLLDAIPQNWVAVALALVVVLAAVNAVNLLDGLDALAGSVSMVALVGLTTLALTRGYSLEAGLYLIAAAAVAGFLLLNLPPASLFLGDNGAYLIGLTLAWAALRLADGWAAGAVAVSAIGVPFLDLGITVVRRIKSGARLFGGDRDHTYDRLHQRGWSPGKVAILFAAAQALWSALIVTLAATAGNGVAALIALPLSLVLVLFVGLRDWSKAEPA